MINQNIYDSSSTKSLILSILIFYSTVIFSYKSPVIFPLITNNRIYIDLGLEDEKSNRYPFSGFLRNLLWDAPLENDKWAKEARRDLLNNKKVVFRANIGEYGYLVGNNIHVIDSLGLADYILARQPKIINAAPLVYGSGHLLRYVPSCYIKWKATDNLFLFAPSIRSYILIVDTITKKPLWSLERFKIIINYQLRKFYKTEMSAQKILESEAACENNERPLHELN